MSQSEIPAIGRLVQGAKAPVIHPVKVRVAQALAARWRTDGLPADPAAVYEAALAELARPALHKVINATGVILHTNLGRAPLGAEACAGLARELDGYCNLEFSLDDGARGSRTGAIEKRIELLVGAEAACVVNNCAAAVFLMLTSEAAGREVVISRGELVQIGGGFRVPDILAASGATLREVGTTNITTAADYAAATSERTACYLKVHQSCFAMHGHVESPSIAELKGAPVFVDLGSGLVSRETIDETTVQAALAADLVCFSGDKLFGGPQAGIIVGARDRIARMKRHPLYRALRLDKASLYFLDHALRAHLAGEPTPAQSMMRATPEELRDRSVRIAAEIPGARVVEDFSIIGGGTTPDVRLPSPVIELPLDDGRALREKNVIARCENGRVLLDLRTVSPSDEKALREALRCLF